MNEVMHTPHTHPRPLIQAIGEETFEEESIRVAYNLREINAWFMDFYNREVVDRFEYRYHLSLFFDIMINGGPPTTNYKKLLNLLDDVVCELPRSITEIDGYGFRRNVIEVFFGRKYHEVSEHAIYVQRSSAKPKLRTLPNTFTPSGKKEIQNICDEYKKRLKECEVYFNAHLSMLDANVRTVKQRKFARCIEKIHTKLEKLETL